MEDGEGRAEAEAAAPRPPPPAGIASPRASTSSGSSNEAADVPSASLPSLAKPADGMPGQDGGGLGRYVMHSQLRVSNCCRVDWHFSEGCGWHPHEVC